MIYLCDFDSYVPFIKIVKIIIKLLKKNKRITFAPFLIRIEVTYINN